MADLPQQKFHHVADNSEERSFASKVTVTQDGLFHMTIPADLVDCVQANLEQGCGLDQFRRRVKPTSMLPKDLKRTVGIVTDRVTGPSLDACKRSIEKGLRDWLKCEITEETVIRYGKRTKTAYWKMADGTIYANGGDCENDPNYLTDGPQHDPRNGGWHGKLDAITHNAGYMVSLFASIHKKTTYTRGSVVEHKYSRPDFSNFSHETWGERLNCFVGLAEDGGWMEDGIECEEMPYTEKSAKFFYEVLIGMCTFADKIEVFFAEPENVMKAIEVGTTLLIERRHDDTS
ncbi:hypothetical protein LCGC14_1886820 [marine sediment metagenome]|uniref:Uncharacterized protein n=1 Tax=marine sediment metagenome TaxID=412755 RepID=A0A0F9IEI5_9ZZZZ